MDTIIVTFGTIDTQLTCDQALGAYHFFNLHNRGQGCELYLNLSRLLQVYAPANSEQCAAALLHNNDAHDAYLSMCYAYDENPAV